MPPPFDRLGHLTATTIGTSYDAEWHRLQVDDQALESAGFESGLSGWDAAGSATVNSSGDSNVHSGLVSVATGLGQEGNMRLVEEIADNPANIVGQVPARQAGQVVTYQKAYAGQTITVRVWVSPDNLVREFSDAWVTVP